MVQMEVSHQLLSSHSSILTLLPKTSIQHQLELEPHQKIVLPKHNIESASPLPSSRDDEFRPFVRRLPEWQFWFVHFPV